MLLTYEVGKTFDTEEKIIETPIKSCRAEVLDEKKSVIVPILRAGLAMASGVREVLTT